MTVHVVTRHLGALEWLRNRGIRWDRQHDRFDGQAIQKDDQVIGILPMRVAAEICSRGARYHHICVDLPNDRRGAELSRDDMEALGARLEEFLVIGVPRYSV